MTEGQQEEESEASLLEGGAGDEDDDDDSRKSGFFIGFLNMTWSLSIRLSACDSIYLMR